MEFGEDYLLEPTSERDTREKILRKLHSKTVGVKDTERLRRYPAMHMLQDRGKGADVRYDFMVEVDPPGWREAFNDMIKALDVLDAHNVYYRLKFSGHRSLHLIILAESFPKIFRGRSFNEQFDEIQNRIKRYLPLPKGVQTPPGFRVVYSMHPTGEMVSIPLRREELPNFQPWMANIYTVAVDYDWFQIPEDAVERNEAFLDIIFDSTAESVTVPPPVVKPVPVKAYKGDPLLSEADVLTGLNSEQTQERVAAARAAFLQNIQLPLELLNQLLHDTKRDVRWFGMEIARRDAIQLSASAVAHLLGVVRSRDDSCLIDLGYELFNQSTVQVDALCSFIQRLDRTRTRRKNMVNALVAIGEVTIESLIEATQTIRDGRIVGILIEALGKIKPPKAVVPALIAALKDEREAVRGKAASALGQMGSDALDAVEGLIQALSDEAAGVRSKAASALGRMGSDASDAVEALINVLEDESTAVRLEAAWALGRMGSDASSAVEALGKALSDKHLLVRRNAATALGRIGESASAAVPALINALSDGDESVRYGAAKALRKIGTPEAIETAKNPV